MIEDRDLGMHLKLVIGTRGDIHTRVVPFPDGNGPTMDGKRTANALFLGRLRIPLFLGASTWKCSQCRPRCRWVEHR